MSKPLKVLNPTEITNLIDFTMSQTSTRSKHLKSERNLTIILLMLEAGLRIGEVVQLRITDLIYDKEPVLWITIRAEITKTETERAIPVSARIKGAIQKMYSDYWPYYGLGENNYAFAGASKSKHITVRQVQNTLSNLSIKSIKRSINPHCLRHTFATRLLNQTNIRTIQKLLGHRQLSSTQIYTHPNTEDLMKAIEASSST